MKLWDSAQTGKLVIHITSVVFVVDMLYKSIYYIHLSELLLHKLMKLFHCIDPLFYIGSSNITYAEISGKYVHLLLSLIGQ